MHFHLSNGAPATFAVDRASAQVILGEVEIQEIPMSDLSPKDWAAAERVFVALDDLDGLRCFAVAC
jgi:hypothetical protein